MWLRLLDSYCPPSFGRAHRRSAGTIRAMGGNTSFASIVSGLIGLLARGPSNPVAVFGSGRALTIPIAGGGVIFLAVVRVAGSQTVYEWVEQTGGLRLYAAASAPVVGLELCNGPAGSGTDARCCIHPRTTGSGADGTIDKAGRAVSGCASAYVPSSDWSRDVSSSGDHRSTSHRRRARPAADAGTAATIVCACDSPSI